MTFPKLQALYRFIILRRENTVLIVFKTDCYSLNGNTDNKGQAISGSYTRYGMSISCLISQ